MSQLQYSGLLVLCLLVTVPLELFYGFKVWRSPKRLFRAVWPGVLVFTLWDVVALRRGHWTFSQHFTLGWKVFGGVAVEEIVFFVVIPAAAISGLEAVKAGLSRKQSTRA